MPTACHQMSARGKRIAPGALSLGRAFSEIHAGRCGPFSENLRGRNRRLEIRERRKDRVAAAGDHPEISLDPPAIPNRSQPRLASQDRGTAAQR